jgi:Transcription factor/nuclear export subunit protein 2
MPRLKHSAADAVFCAKFIHRLHTLNAWGFPSIQIYDKVQFFAGSMAA